jgi:hypothetical protein
MQERAFVALCQNKWILQDIIKKYDGKVVSGSTESGILAAAHLGGAGSVKRYFKNNGENIYQGCIRDFNTELHGSIWRI